MRGMQIVKKYEAFSRIGDQSLARIIPVLTCIQPNSCHFDETTPTPKGLVFSNPNTIFAFDHNHAQKSLGE